MTEPYGARQFSSTTNALSTTAEIVLAARPQRIQAILLNTDASITMYVGDASVDSTYFPLKGGASMTLTTTAVVYAVAATGTPTLAIFEEFN